MTVCVGPDTDSLLAQEIVKVNLCGLFFSVSETVCKYQTIGFFFYSIFLTSV